MFLQIRNLEPLRQKSYCQSHANPCSHLIFISIFDGQFSDPPSHLSRAEWDVVGGQTEIVEECLQ